MSSFANLRAQRNNSYSDLVKNLDNANKGGGFKKDERVYYPERDAQGNGSAKIRFLPAPEGNQAPFVKTFSHGFKGPGGWMIEECPTTIGRGCPVCEANSALWQTGDKEKKEIASNRKRKVGYTANILVVKDSKNPENEGKVFLFNFGQKIFDKIAAAAKPKFDDIKPVNVFDLWEGATFNLRIQKVSGNTNYDESSFDPASALSDSDERLEEIYNQEYDLRPFLDEGRYKSETELATKFARVTGETRGSKTAEDAGSEEASAPSRSAPSRESSPSAGSASAGNTAEAEDPISFFENLGKEE